MPQILAPTIRLGDICPPAGHYVLYDRDTGGGPFESEEEAVAFLRQFVCSRHCAPEFLQYVVVVSDGTTLDLCKRDGKPLNGELVRGTYPTEAK